MSSTVVPSRRLPLDLQLLSPFLGPPTNAQHTSNGHRPPGRRSSALLDERSIWIPVRRAYSTDTHTDTLAFTSTSATLTPCALSQHVPTSVPRASRGRLGEVPLLPEQPLLLEEWRDVTL